MAPKLAACSNQGVSRRGERREYRALQRTGGIRSRNGRPARRCWSWRWSSFRADGPLSIARLDCVTMALALLVRRAYPAGAARHDRVHRDVRGVCLPVPDLAAPVAVAASERQFTRSAGARIRAPSAGSGATCDAQIPQSRQLAPVLRSGGPEILREDAWSRMRLQQSLADTAAATATTILAALWPDSHHIRDWRVLAAVTGLADYRRRGDEEPRPGRS